jgi:hypothetical protein
MKGTQTWIARKTPRRPAIAAGILAPLIADNVVIPVTNEIISHLSCQVGIQQWHPCHFVSGDSHTFWHCTHLPMPLELHRMAPARWSPPLLGLQPSSCQNQTAETGSSGNSVPRGMSNSHKTPQEPEQQNPSALPGRVV